MSEQDLPDPTGFKKHPLVRNPYTTHRIDLYLPTQLKDELDVIEARERQQRMDEADRRADAPWTRKAPEGQVAGIETPEAAVAASAKEKVEAQAAGNAEEKAAEEEPLYPLAGTDYDPKQEYPVYGWKAADALMQKATSSTPDKEIKKRDEQLSKKLDRAGPLRRVAIPATALQALETLRERQPHFGAVVDLVRDQIHLAARATRAARIPPILLDGEPGVGKTHFAIALAAALGTVVRRVAFDSAITSATLMGSERRWGNTSYGLLFELIALGAHANPIIILDEIDKAEARREWDPLAPLHTLLEPATAVKTRDISVDFEFDASQVTWIATSNFRLRLAASLRSRFQEFHIQRPGGADAIRNARSVIAKAFEALHLTDFEPPGKDLAIALAHWSSREIRQATEQAVARAVANGRNRVGLADLPRQWRDDDGTPDGSGPSGNTKTTLH